MAEIQEKQLTPLVPSQRRRLRAPRRVLASCIAFLACGFATAFAADFVLDSVVSKLEAWGYVPVAPSELVGAGEILAGRAYGRGAPPIIVIASLAVGALVAWVPLLAALLVYDRLTTAKLAADGKPRCRRCGYLLIQLTCNRCPECGSDFAPVPEVKS